MNKALIIIIAGLVIASAVWITALYFKIQSTEKKVIQLEITIANKDVDIVKAQSALEMQKTYIEQFKLDQLATLDNYTKSVDKLKKKYDEKLKQAYINSKDNASCESVLAEIYNLQKGFLYE